MSTRSELLAEKSLIESQIATLNLTISKTLATDIRDYKFDSGEGSQAATRRDPDKLFKLLQSLESKLEFVKMRLAGTGIMNITLVR